MAYGLKMSSMTDKELHRELSALTRDRTVWRERIPSVAALLEGQSVKITAKALWLLGEMGLKCPGEVEPCVGAIATFLDSRDDLLRERALNALGRIGRARFEAVEPYWERMFALADDGNPRVRLAFIWASENIATNTPDIYEQHRSTPSCCTTATTACGWKRRRCSA